MLCQLFFKTVESFTGIILRRRQIMLWEKKTQLAREAKATVDSEVGQGEIRAMNAEIHRMEVRHTQLMKLQEKLIQDMEKAVSRRDTIVTRGDAQAKLNKKVETKGAFQKKLAELKKRIKQVQQVKFTVNMFHLFIERAQMPTSPSPLPLSSTNS